MSVIALTRTTPGAVSDANANLNNNWTLLEALLNGDLDTGNLDPAAGITGAQLAAAAGILGSQLAAAAGITAAQLAAAVRDAVGLNDGTTVRRGKSIIATEEARTNVAYGTLTTPDQVANLVLPTDGLIRVAYQAMWKESVNNTANAAIFFGANQIKIADATTASPGVQEAANAKGADVYGPLYSAPLGLSPGISGVGADTTAYTGDVTTGQLVGMAGATPNGGVCVVFAAAGTYTVSIQFRASSGTVTAKNRKLWVEAIGF